MMTFILATDFDFIAYMSKMAFLGKLFTDVGKVMMTFILATDFDFIAYMSNMAFFGGSFFHANGVFGI